MKVAALASILVFSTLCFGQAPAQNQKGLSKNQIVDLLKAGMESEVLAKAVQDRGIDFEPSDEDVAALRKAGAQDVLIRALRAVKPTPLTREQVLQLVVAGVPSQRAATIVKQRGIDFMPDEEYLGTLRVAGASDALLAAARAAGEVAKVKPKSEPEKVNPKDGLKYVWIPPGSFMMGCSASDAECAGNEKPAHRVTISKGFWLGQTEVSVGAYKRFARETGKGMPPEPKFVERALNSGWTNDAMPIVNVSWDDAVAYCAWAGGRLPTEAEWEYAARAGSTEARYGPLDDVAWCADNSGVGRIDSARILREEQNKYAERLRDNGNRMHEVAQKRANSFGLFDMLGNVWEWVSDWYGEKYYEGSPERDAQGPGSGDYRVVRGGSWRDPPWSTRASYRAGSRPVKRDVDVGFRCLGEVVP